MEAVQQSGFEIEDRAWGIGGVAIQRGPILTISQSESTVAWLQADARQLKLADVKEPVAPKKLYDIKTNYYEPKKRCDVLSQDSEVKLTRRSGATFAFSDYCTVVLQGILLGCRAR
ncbi:hypothetical protein PMAYCL1PPCAC_08409, partial [Pristionchus mayeri]